MLKLKNYSPVYANIVAEYQNEIIVLEKKGGKYGFRCTDFEGNVTGLSTFYIGKRAEVGGEWRVYRGVLYFLRSRTNYRVQNV